MFIEQSELSSAIAEYQLAGIDASMQNIRQAINAAVDEAKSYLNNKYDCDAIFSATGEKRHATVLEHCINMAVWYIVRKGNTDMIFEHVKEYRKAAVEWFRDVAGLNATGKPLTPDLPLKTEDGKVKISIRMGSNRKFRHSMDD